MIREKYHFTTQDLESMDWEQFDFLVHYAEAEQREIQRQIDTKAPKGRGKR